MYVIAHSPHQIHFADAIGIPTIAKCMLNSGRGKAGYPKVVMLSSAGVTRPSWTEEKKSKLSGCADIPIVRLNPVAFVLGDPLSHGVVCQF